MTTATASTGSLIPPGSAGRAVGVLGAASPGKAPPTTLSTGGPEDFPSPTARRDPPRPVRILYRPGESRVAWTALRDPDLRQVAQALCLDLEVEPAQLGFERWDADAAWVLADRIDDATGTTVRRRVAQVRGLSCAWMVLAARGLVESGWRPTRDYPAPAATEPPAPSSGLSRGPDALPDLTPV